MANGDIIAIGSWEGQESGFQEWYAYDTTGGTLGFDTGQSVPDGSAACLKISKLAQSGALTIEEELDPSGAIAAYSTGCISFYFKGSTTIASGSNEDILNIYRYANTARNARLYFDSTGALRVGFWTTNKVSSTITTIDSGWHYIQFAWDFSTTTNKIKLRVDGVAYAEETYTAAASPALDYLQLGNATNLNSTITSTKYFGGVLFTEGYYFPQKHKIRLLRPTSDVDTNWSTTGANRYSVVAESPPNDATYISSSTSGQTQRLEMSDVTLTAGETISAVRMVGRNAAGVGTVPGADLNLVEAGGAGSSTVRCGSTITSYFTDDVMITTKPSGGAWTESVLNGLRFRLVKDANTDTCRISELGLRVAIAAPSTITQALTAGLSFTSAQTRLKKVRKTLTAAASFVGNLATRPYKSKNFTATLSFTGSPVQFMWRQLQDAGGWFVKRGRLQRRRPY